MSVEIQAARQRQAQAQAANQEEQQAEQRRDSLAQVENQCVDGRISLEAVFGWP